VNTFSLEGKVGLPSAAKQPKSTKDQSRCLLDSDVGIKAQADLPMPNVADRHRNPQLPAPGLGTGGVVHAGAQHAEFELADAALHAQ